MTYLIIIVYVLLLKWILINGILSVCVLQFGEHSEEVLEALSELGVDTSDYRVSDEAVVPSTEVRPLSDIDFVDFEICAFEEDQKVSNGEVVSDQV